MRCLALIPAFEAERTVGGVVSDLLAIWPRAAGLPPVVVVDDGSTDRTASVAESAGASLLRLPKNQGKGAALRAGLERARALGADAVVTVDADGQHPANEALRLLQAHDDADRLVLGVRDLREAGAPGASQFSNAFSNLWVARFGGVRFADTQCGLRRYPVSKTLALGVRSRGFAFESELLVRAARAGWPCDEVPVRVVYPKESERQSHFHVVRDPTRIVLRLLYTTFTTPRRREP